MDENEFKKELLSLQNENKELRSQIDKLISNKDYSSYSIYIEARKKFIAWVSIIILLISAFGIVSVTSIINSIKNKIEEKGIESIVNEIKTDFIELHQTNIVEETIIRIQPVLESKIDDAIRSELMRATESIQNISKTSNDIHLFQAIKKSYDDTRYNVIAGSSTRKRDLEEELQRVKKLVGSSFNELFPSIVINNPVPGNRNYSLSIAQNLTYKKAKEYREKAIRSGFREDTFISRQK